MLRAALIGLLAETPLEHVTVRALTARAGIGYATFFRNYPDIDALLADVSHGYICELAALFPSDNSSPPAEISRTIVSFFEDRRAVLGPLFVGAGAALERDIVAHAITVARLASKRMASAVSLTLAVAHVVNSCLTILGWWLRDAPHASGEEIATLIETLALRPLLLHSPPI